MKTQSILLTKPLKEVPRRIVFKSPEKYRVFDNLNGTKTYAHIYNMVDVETKEVVGTMKAGPVEYKNRRWQIYPMDIPYKSYYVAYVESADSGFGYGSDLLKLAETESRRTGCEGRVHLTASRVYTPSRPPHLFYRKRGFVSVSPYLNEVMDFYISMGKPLPSEYADNIEMYLPVAMRKTGTQSKLKMSSIVNFFKDKFTKK